MWIDDAWAADLSCYRLRFVTPEQDEPAMM